MITAFSQEPFKCYRYYSGEEEVARENFYDEIVQNFTSIDCISVSGDDLETCCRLLGRPLPNCEIYTFYGDNAKEICLNLRETIRNPNQ
jgi:hypothetical protein